MGTIKFDIKKEIAVLSQKGDYEKVLGIVSFGENPPKFDIRTFNHERTMLRKGITLTLEEVKLLQTALKDVDLDELYNKSL